MSFGINNEKTNKSNLMAGAVQMKANLREQGSDYLQF